jgi:hypothetical protein
LIQLPWQSIQIKKRSKHLLVALEALSNDIIDIDDIRNHFWICQTHRQQGQHNLEKKSTRFINVFSTSLPVHFNQRIQRIVDFLINLHILCRSILQSEGIRTKGLHIIWDEFAFIDALSRTGNCPDLVANLLVRLFPKSTLGGAASRLPENELGFNLHHRKSRTILPLHQWCEADSEYPDDDGMLASLLKIPDNIDYSNASVASLASIPDPRSRKLPLVTAIQHGKSWSSVRLLFLADPSVLHESVSLGLPIFAWAAIASSLKTTEYMKQRIQFMAKQKMVGEKGMISLWNLARSDLRQMALENAVQMIECDQLTTIYEALLACPTALTDLFK